MFAHHSPADSPGRGTIAATRIISVTGTRSHTSGAMNPASDWATSTTSRAVADGVDDDVGVLGEPGGVVVDGRSTATTS